MRGRTVWVVSLLLLNATGAMAQFRSRVSGMFVAPGTVLAVDGLSLIPSSSLQITDIEITRIASEVVFPRYKSINRTYLFSKALAFTGTAGIRFLASELNGNDPSGLRIAWSPLNNLSSLNYLIASNGQLSISGDRVQSVLSGSSISSITAVSPIASLQTLDVTNFVTPNGDGVNDTWIVQNIQLYPGNEAKVFDRNGRVIYSKRDYDNSWDASINGLPLSESTYYYVVTDASGGLIVKGYITITR